jgi:flagellar basal-body rod protein FlgB
VIDRLLSTEMMDLVQRSLDASALSQEVISNNLANVDTPGFKRSDVVFNETLRKAMEARKGTPQQLALERTQEGHLDITGSSAVDEVQPEVVTDVTSTLRNDGNNVDIDREVALLSQNTAWYQTLSQITQMQFSSLRTAILEGRR